MKKYIDFIFKSLTLPNVITLFFIVGFIVFGNTLVNDFVTDDKFYIVNNSLSHTVDVAVSFGPNDFNTGGQYRPIPAVYFSVLYSLFGSNPFFYHLLQIILHCICTALLYILFKKYIPIGISLFLSLIFLVHPMNVESVSYIAQSVNQIFFILGISALLIIAKNHVTHRQYVFVFFLLLLSLLTKETGILFVFMVVFYCFLFKKNILKNIVIVSISVLAIYAFFRIVIGNVFLSSRPSYIAELPLIDRLSNIPMVMFYYFKTFFFPKVLVYNQQWVIDSITVSSFYLPLIINIALLTCIALSGFHIVRHHKVLFKPFLFFSLWFLLGLSFHLQIFPLDMTVADRWFYFPMAGFLAVIGIMYQHITKKVSFPLIIPFFLAISIICSLSMRTIVRNADWQNAIKLYTHDMHYYTNDENENNLGVEYTFKKDYQNAIKHYKKSVALRPYESNLYNLGVSYTYLGDMRQAKKTFEMALYAKDYKLFLPHKHHINTYKSYASTLIYYEEDTLAKSVIQNALTDYPNDFSLWYLLALVEYRQGNKPEAISAASKAHTVNPNEPFIYTNILNNKSFTMNFFDKAIEFKSN